MLKKDFKHDSFMVVISSPSGAGKSTICRRLVELDSSTTLSISATTRTARVSEQDGVDYNFISHEAFAHKIENGKMLEYAKIFGNYYGTQESDVLLALEKGHDVLFDIDWQGLRQLKALEFNGIVSIFILPPSFNELKSRLNSRNQDSEEIVAHRMDEAMNEILHYTEYDYVVINDDLEKTITLIHAIILTERIRRANKKKLATFVAELMS